MFKLFKLLTLSIYIVGLIFTVYKLGEQAYLQNTPFLYVGSILLFILGVFSLAESYLLKTRRSPTTAPKVNNNVDAVIFVDQEDIESIKISIVSVQKMKAVNEPVLVMKNPREDVDFLCSELSIKKVECLSEVKSLSEHVLISNASIALYPDAMIVARRQFDEGIDVVELNYSKKVLSEIRQEANVYEPSIQLDIARALGTHRIFSYTGSSVVVSKSLFKRLQKNFNNAKGFIEVMAGILSFRSKGTITSHSCCEPISKNEITNSLDIRATKFKVISVLKRQKSKVQTSWREKVSNVYYSVLFFKVISLVAISLYLPLLIASGFWSLIINPTNVGLIIGLLALDKVYKKLSSDQRNYKNLILDNMFEIEAYLKATRTPLKFVRYLLGYRLKLPVLYVSFLYLCSVIAGYSLIKNSAEKVSESITTVVSIFLLLLLVGFIYNATKIYFSAQHRAFIRRKVSIPGSSSYESMWIVDLTHRGAGYISDSRLEIGDETLLVFRLPNSADDQLLSVVGKVTYCGIRQDQYQIGVEFKELPIGTQDALMYYTCVMHPYSVARSIETEYSVPKEVLRKFRYGFVKDPLTMCVSTFSIFLLIFLSVSLIPVRRGGASGTEISGTLAAVESSPISSSAAEISFENKDAVLDAKLISESKVEKHPSIKVKNEFLNISETGFLPQDKVKIKIKLTNTGSRVALKGISLKTNLSSALRTTSLRLISSKGFSPCGFKGSSLNCQTTKSLGPKKNLEIVVEGINDAIPTTSSRNRLIASQAELSRRDTEKYNLDQTLSQSTYDSVVPVGGSSSIGGKVFQSLRGVTKIEPSDPGFAGVRVTLRRFDDKNKNGKIDLGESETVASDSSDSYGYFGAAKGNSNFMKLQPNKQYSLQYTQIPKGFVTSSSGLKISDSKSAGFKDLSISDEFEQVSISTPWFKLKPDQYSSKNKLGLRTRPKDLKFTFEDERNRSISNANVRLLKWVDFNQNGGIDSDEIIKTSFVTKSTNVDGEVLFKDIKSHSRPTKFAIQSDVQENLRTPINVIEGNVKDFSKYKDKFINLSRFNNSSTIEFGLVGSSVAGQLFADFNSNLSMDELEYPVEGIEITLTNVANGTIRKTTTNIQGTYEFDDVNSGEHRIAINNYSAPFGYETWPIANNVFEVKESKSIAISPMGISPTSDLNASILRYDSLSAARTLSVSAIITSIFSGKFSEIDMFESEKLQYQEVLLISSTLLWILMVALLAHRRKFFQKI